jgi:hypothetical protein
VEKIVTKGQGSGLLRLTPRSLRTVQEMRSFH